MRPTLLIVEDEQRLREFLERAAAGLDLEPVAVRSAEQALRVMAGRPVHLLLLDLTLPGLGGLELLARIRQTQGDAIPAIVLTGYGSLDAAKAAVRLDVVDFLTKPCSLEELDQALSRARSRMTRPDPLVTRYDVDDVETASLEVGKATPPSQTLDAIEREHILSTLRAHNGNRTATAAALGISERTLYYRLRRYSLEQSATPES